MTKVLSKIISSPRTCGSMNPSDLLIALHFVQTEQCLVKNVIKGKVLITRIACDWCIGETRIFTEEVIVFTLQHLISYDTLPTILMRTVIRCHIVHNSLLGFIINYLQQLITKQVWKNPSLWKGFIKCCKRTRPQSITVLLQLPQDCFYDLIKEEPELAASLKVYMLQMTKSQVLI
ncbi:symplekin-like [Octopus sinensis]|uniref:Symplekin-like n=1 Tax=Octopus sinensis TaxID=2607531 RepID=A0A7E6EJB1_9MOLL|nr:symplekin-like [Octopus sinensis]